LRRRRPQAVEHIALTYEYSRAVLNNNAPGPAAPRLPRLEAAVRVFEDDLRAADRSGRSAIDHPFFGTMPITDYLRLQAIHARHHRAQVPGAAATV
jgi:hypothetical protein